MDEPTGEQPQKTVQVQKVEPRKLTRREALKLMFLGGTSATSIALGIDSLLAHLGAETATSNFWKRLETGTLGMSEQDTAKLEKELEERLQINIVNPSEQKSTVVNIRGVTAPTLPWEAPDLAALAMILDELPTYFYSPRGAGSDRSTGKFVLFNAEFPGVNYPDDRGGCWCWSEPTEIQLAKGKNWDVLRFATARGNMAHELVHRATTASSTEELKLIQKIKSDVSIENVEQLQKIFKDEIRGGLWYGGTNFREFLAIGGQNYIDGERWFRGLYEPYLGELRTDRWYGLLRDDIFKGKEYG